MSGQGHTFTRSPNEDFSLVYHRILSFTLKKFYSQHPKYRNTITPGSFENNIFPNLAIVILHRYVHDTIKLSFRQEMQRLQQIHLNHRKKFLKNQVSLPLLDISFGTSLIEFLNKHESCERGTLYTGTAVIQLRPGVYEKYLKPYLFDTFQDLSKFVTCDEM